MNVTETVREWVDVTDGAVANTIFGEYGFTPDPGNLDDDSPAHTSDSASLMQRATDAQFLRDLARRSGKLFRVFCTDTPGQRTGSFGKPSLDGDPVTILTLNDADRRHCRRARHLLGRDASERDHCAAGAVHRQRRDGAGGNTTDHGLADLDAARARRFHRQRRSPRC